MCRGKEDRGVRVLFEGHTKTGKVGVISRTREATEERETRNDAVLGTNPLSSLSE